MTITERIKKDARMISRPLYIFLGTDELKQLLIEEPDEIFKNTEIFMFDLIEIIEVNKKSFFLVVG